MSKYSYICEMRTDKDKLKPALNAFKKGDIDIDYMVNYIFSIYSVSKRFNWNNFACGILVGGILIYLLI